MDLAKFIREYLCVWPADLTKSALDMERWDALTVAPVDAPADFALCFDCEINGQSASISAGWVDPVTGKHRIQLLDKRRGVQWLTEELARGSAAFPRVRIAYDPIGQNAVVAMALQRVPKFRAAALKPMNLREMSAAAALVAQGLDGETLEISEDSELRKDAEAATWRESGDNRLFGRRGGADISGMISGAGALHTAVQSRPRQRLTIPDTLTG